MGDLVEDAAIRWLRGQEKHVAPGEPSGREALARIIRANDALPETVKTYLVLALEETSSANPRLEIIKAKGQRKSDTRKFIEDIVIGERVHKYVGSDNKEYLMIEEYCKKYGVGKATAIRALAEYRKAKGLTP